MNAIRKQAYKDEEWDLYKKLVCEINSARFMIKNECLSYLLFKLDIPYQIYAKSIAYFRNN